MNSRREFLLAAGTAVGAVSGVSLTFGEEKREDTVEDKVQIAHEMFLEMGFTYIGEHVSFSTARDDDGLIYIDHSKPISKLRTYQKEAPAEHVCQIIGGEVWRSTKPVVMIDERVLDIRTFNIDKKRFVKAGQSWGIKHAEKMQAATGEFFSGEIS